MKTGPNITTRDEPGITIPKKQVKIQVKRTIPILEKSIEIIKFSISDAMFRSLNIEPIIYPKMQTAIAGAIVLTLDAKVLARAFGVTNFLSFTIRQAKRVAIPAINRIRLFER